MGDSAEVSAPILDAGQIEVTTVQVVQNVDADRILGTLKWLVDRVNKLSEGPLKDDIRDVRELIQGSSDLLAEQCKKQVTCCPLSLFPDTVALGTARSLHFWY